MLSKELKVDKNKQIKVFDYIPVFDAFLCTKEFKNISGLLGLNEWTPVVWMGRLFARNQDFGEHLFDNWDEREELKEIPYDYPEGESYDTLLIVNPDRLTQFNRACITCGAEPERLPCPNCKDSNIGIYLRADGPCYSPKITKQFWTELLKCLTLSLDFMINLAREEVNDENEDLMDGFNSKILEKNIQELLGA